MRKCRWKQLRKIKPERKEIKDRQRAYILQAERVSADRHREQAQMEEDRKKEERLQRERQREKGKEWLERCRSSSPSSSR